MGAGSFRTWLLLLAKYKALDRRRQLLRHGETAELRDDSGARAKSVEQDALSRETARELIDFVRGLGEPDQSLFWRRYFHYEGLEQLAERFGLTKKAVENRLYRCRTTRVTAFPKELGNGIVRVQLVPKLPDNNRLYVNSYGVRPLVKGAGLYVEDANGTKAELPNGDTMSYPSDFRFREPEGGLRPYTVVIPYLEVSDRDAISGEIAVPLPPVGSSRSIDALTTISGFPVSFTRIERLSETSVGVDVDVRFDPSKPQTLQYFGIRYAGSKFNDSFGWETAEKGFLTIKTLGLEVKPGQTELRFSLAEPHVLYKGPWRLTLDPQ